MTETPARDWILHRLNSLLADAEGAGIALDVAVALITDIIDSPDFNTALPQEPEPSHPDSHHEINAGVGDEADSEGNRLARQEFHGINQHGRTFV